MSNILRHIGSPASRVRPSFQVYFARYEFHSLRPWCFRDIKTDYTNGAIEATKNQLALQNNGYLKLFGIFIISTRVGFDFNQQPECAWNEREDLKNTM